MGFVTRAIGWRIAKAADAAASNPEVRAGIERSHRELDLAEVAREIAGIGLGDESACARLRERLPEHREPATGSIRHLGALRTSYLDDRAYRLLTAAVNSTPVRPIDSTVHELFSAEARLGRLSLSEAFAYLVSLEPRLADEPALRTEKRTPSRSGFRWGNPEPPLVGPMAERPQAVLNTELAAAIVREYTTVTNGGRLVDDEQTPFFERRKRTFGGTLVMFGKGRRPRARN